MTAVRRQWGWTQIRIGLRDEVAVASRPFGDIGVDCARFMFADAHALGSWVDNVPLDGLADLVFWGRDAADIAAEFGAQRTRPPGEDCYGWLNMPARTPTREPPRWTPVGRPTHRADSRSTSGPIHTTGRSWPMYRHPRTRLPPSRSGAPDS
ncbi:hypothetical protein KRMM14A1259_48380 [Krasilnikovia sp. MM14-A1259]